MLSRSGIRTTGVDLSEAMIEAAKRRAGKLTSFVVGSALDLPFEDESFDAVILSLALHEHRESERQAMAREALRVLRSQGLLLLADYMEPDHPALNAPWQLVRLIERLAGREHREGFHDFVRLGGLKELARRLGVRRYFLHASHFGAIGILWTRKSSCSG
jgi:ubiquinone/menaquinone biosynthesis C-methylase UbiE